MDSLRLGYGAGRLVPQRGGVTGHDILNMEILHAREQIWGAP